MYTLEYKIKIRAQFTSSSSSFQCNPMRCDAMQSKFGALRLNKVAMRGWATSQQTSFCSSSQLEKQLYSSAVPSTNYDICNICNFDWLAFYMWTVSAVLIKCVFDALFFAGFSISFCHSVLLNILLTKAAHSKSANWIQVYAYMHIAHAESV